MRVEITLDDDVQAGCMPSCGCEGNIRGDRTIAFDEFFEVMVKKIIEERKFSDNIIFESSTRLITQ